MVLSNSLAVPNVRQEEQGILVGRKQGHHHQTAVQSRVRRSTTIANVVNHCSSCYCIVFRSCSSSSSSPPPPPRRFPFIVKTKNKYKNKNKTKPAYVVVCCSHFVAATICCSFSLETLSRTTNWCSPTISSKASTNKHSKYSVRWTSATTTVPLKSCSTNILRCLCNRCVRVCVCVCVRVRVRVCGSGRHGDVTV